MAVTFESYERRIDQIKPNQEMLRLVLSLQQQAKGVLKQERFIFTTLTGSKLMLMDLVQLVLVEALEQNLLTSQMFILLK